MQEVDQAFKEMEAKKGGLEISGLRVPGRSKLKKGRAHTSDKDDPLETLSKDGKEGERPEGPLALRPALASVVDLGERLRELDPPLDPRSVELEEREARDEDDGC